MKIAITGALGHIGSSIIRELPTVLSYPEIIMIDNLSTQRYASLFNLPKNARYKFVEADVLEADLDSLFSGVDVVLHLAAITNAAGSFAMRSEVERVNYNATLRVANACSNVGCSLIHLSSTSVYGTQNEVVDESCTIEELKPQSPYAETKLREEDFLVKLGSSDKLNFIICRFGTITGVSPGMRFHTAVNKFCWQAVLGQAITVWRTALHQKRPYLTLKEAVEAIKFIIQNNLFDKTINNVLSGNYTVHSIVNFIKEYIPTLNIEYVDTEIMNQLSYEVLDNRFREKGFSYQGDVQKSIAETISWLIACGGGNDDK